MSTLKSSNNWYITTSSSCRLKFTSVAYRFLGVAVLMASSVVTRTKRTHQVFRLLGVAVLMASSVVTRRKRTHQVHLKAFLALNFFKKSIVEITVHDKVENGKKIEWD
ncbi:hypothetical protein TNCV_2869671 [Trichonephila clavipes]|nr:hypothetical protein TNCV_2869671 [Trichonephila clavipes]